MYTPKYCAVCAASLQHHMRDVDGPRRPQPSLSDVGVDADARRMFAAQFVQAKQVGALVEAMAATGAVPLLDMLDSWWRALAEKQRQAFATALLERALDLLGRGHFDKEIERVVTVSSLIDTERLAAAVADGDKGAEVYAHLAKLYHARMLDRASADKFSRELASELVRALRDQLATHLEPIREELKSRAIDALPPPEQLVGMVTDRVTKELADSIRRNIQRD